MPVLDIFYFPSWIFSVFYPLFFVPQKLNSIGINSINCLLCPLASIWGLPVGITNIRTEYVRKKMRGGKCHVYFPVFLLEGFLELAACFQSLSPSSVDNFTFLPLFNLWLVIASSTKGLEYWTVLYDFPTLGPHICKWLFMKLSSSYPFLSVPTVSSGTLTLITTVHVFAHNLLLYLFGIVFHITFFFIFN